MLVALRAEAADRSEGAGRAAVPGRRPRSARNPRPGSGGSASQIAHTAGRSAMWPRMWESSNTLPGVPRRGVFEVVEVDGQVVGGLHEHGRAPACATAPGTGARSRSYSTTSPTPTPRQCRARYSAAPQELTAHGVAASQVCGELAPPSSGRLGAAGRRLRRSGTAARCAAAAPPPRSPRRGWGPGWPGQIPRAAAADRSTGRSGCRWRLAGAGRVTQLVGQPPAGRCRRTRGT